MSGQFVCDQCGKTTSNVIMGNPADWYSVDRVGSLSAEHHHFCSWRCVFMYALTAIEWIAEQRGRTEESA